MVLHDDTHTAVTAVKILFICLASSNSSTFQTTANKDGQHTCTHVGTRCQWLKWSCNRGITRGSQVGANPIPIPHATNLALFGHKITLYRFNQGGGS